MVRQFIKQRAKIKGMETEFDTQQMNQIMKVSEEIKKSPIYIDDSPEMSVEYMRKQCLRIMENEKISFVAIDYLQLLNTDGFNDSREGLNQATHELKKLANELDCPLLVLSQLNRAVEKRGDHRPRLSDIRDADEVEAIADEVWLLYRDEYYDRFTDNKNLAELHVCKSRNGQTCLIDLAFLPEYPDLSS